MVKICFLARVCKIAECPEYSKAFIGWLHYSQNVTWVWKMRKIKGV